MARVKEYGRIRLLPLALAVAALALAGCENDLLNYFWKDLLYQGWQARSWSAPAPVVDGETHLVVDKSNGYPMNMVMGSNGRLHLFAWRVDLHQWVYTTREPTGERFQQSYQVIQTISNPGGLAVMPAIELISDEAPMIAYADNSSPCVVSYQEYIVGGGWSSRQTLYSISGAKATRVFLFFFVSDFKPYVFYVTNESPNKLYYTRRMNSSSIDPNPPDVVISDVGPICAVKTASSDAAFVYADSARSSLYYRTYSDPSVVTLWAVPDPSVAIGEIAADVDSNGNIHVCFGVYKAADFLNPDYYALHYLRQEGNAWRQEQSISASGGSGPSAVFFPPSIEVAPDKYGIDRVHLAYSQYKAPANSYVWYARYSEAGWEQVPQSLDTTNVISGWTFPILRVDPDGVYHVVYSWAVNDNDRTAMYVRGTPQEAQ